MASGLIGGYGPEQENQLMQLVDESKSPIRTLMLDDLLASAAEFSRETLWRRLFACLQDLVEKEDHAGLAKTAARIALRRATTHGFHDKMSSLKIIKSWMDMPLLNKDLVLRKELNRQGILD